MTRDSADQVYSEQILNDSGYSSFDDADTTDEVDAVFRIQRRIALGYFAIFLFVTLGVGIAIVTLDWATSATVFGGFSPGFALAGFGLYAFFVILAAGASSLANTVEDRMMGPGSLPSERPAR